MAEPSMAERATAAAALATSLGATITAVSAVSTLAAQSNAVALPDLHTSIYRRDIEDYNTRVTDQIGDLAAALDIALDALVTLSGHVAAACTAIAAG